MVFRFTGGSFNWQDTWLLPKQSTSYSRTGSNPVPPAKFSKGRITFNQKTDCPICESSDMEFGDGDHTFVCRSCLTSGFVGAEGILVAKEKSFPD